MLKLKERIDKAPFFMFLVRFNKLFFSSYSNIWLSWKHDLNEFSKLELRRSQSLLPLWLRQFIESFRHLSYTVTKAWVWGRGARSRSSTSQCPLGKDRVLFRQFFFEGRPPSNPPLPCRTNDRHWSLVKGWSGPQNLGLLHARVINSVKTLIQGKPLSCYPHVQMFSTFSLHEKRNENQVWLLCYTACVPDAFWHNFIQETSCSGAENWVRNLWVAKSNVNLWGSFFFKKDM